MIEKLFPARLGAAMLTLLCAVAHGQQQNSAFGPDDDLGTLPSKSSNNNNKPPTVNDDDLGTLPSSKGEDSAPTLTMSGPVTLVTGLLSGLRGSGEVGYGPGPELGSVTAYLTGDLTLALHLADPRLARVRIELHTGDLPSLGELSAGGRSSGAFHLAPGTHMGLPVQALFQRQLSELHNIHLGLLTVAGEVYQLGVRTHGALLVLEQRIR